MSYCHEKYPPSSPDTEYLSFSEESDVEQYQHTLILNSTSAVTLRTESQTSRAILCINAARLLLIETSRPSNQIGSLRPYRQEALLKSILSICVEWASIDHDDLDNVNQILELPLFASSIQSVRVEPRPCTIQYIEDLIKELQRRAASVVIEGTNDTITVIGLPGNRNEPRTKFIVFNPRCRSSPELNEASLRFFPSPWDTVRHIFQLINIFRTTDEARPPSLYNSQIFILGDGVYDSDNIRGIYQANLTLLQRNIHLKVRKSVVDSVIKEMKNVAMRVDLMKEEVAASKKRKKEKLRQIERLQFELQNTEAMTAAILGSSAETGPMRKEDVEMEDLMVTSDLSWFAQRNVWQSYLPTQPPRSFGHGSSVDTRRRFSDSDMEIGSSPDTLWDAEQGTTRHQEQIKKDEVKKARMEKLQARLAEEEASLAYARQLEAEELEATRALEDLKQANKSFECPVCVEEYHESFLAKAERCDHVVCRECMLSHVKSQIEEMHWPIFCPMCPSSEDKRGVVTRRIAEIVGGDERLFEAWNRMELGSVSIGLECPRCKETTRVDSQDFREADILDCPLGCGAHWCKDCHQEVERGKKHSCDGQEEFNELVKQQNWKACPECGAMAERISGCNQLTCKYPGCNTSFCYVCGGMITKTTSINELLAAKSRHYQTCRLWN